MGEQHLWQPVQMWPWTLQGWKAEASVEQGVQSKETGDSSTYSKGALNLMSNLIQKEIVKKFRKGRRHR